MNAWIIRCSLMENPGNMLDTLPLPYDYEITGDNDGITDEQLFEQGKLIRLPNTKYNG